VKFTQVVKFKDAVLATPDVKKCWCKGLQALIKEDRKHIHAEDSNQLTGSVAIDEALRTKYPNCNRWDYAVGYRHSNSQTDKVYFVEVHPASGKQIKVILNKLAWLKQWLNNSAKTLNPLPKKFVWVSSSKVQITSTSPQGKIVAQKRIVFAGRVLKIPK